MKFRISPQTEYDLRDIAAYIAEHNPDRAISFVAEIRAEFSAIAHSPYAYQGRPELPQHIRRAVFGDYLILFSIREEYVFIRRVIHGSRDLSRL
jgi:toxin ParE1/3/4